MTLAWSTTLSGSIESRTAVATPGSVNATSDVGSGNVRRIRPLYTVMVRLSGLPMTRKRPGSAVAHLAKPAVLYLVSAGIGGDGLYAFANTVPGP